ncbi:MAG: LCP family protein [Clostridia bacterium]|nr:LCP family protein [Clostridia bacterium]
MEKTEQKKKGLSTAKKIIVAVLALLILLIVGFGAFTLIKLYGMSRNAAKIVAKPTFDPNDTPDPGVELITGDPGKWDVDVDDPIDPNLIYDEGIYQQDPIDPNVINILIMGEDRRSTAETGRSDMMLVFSYNMKTNTIKAISILRDTWVYIPERTTWNRINAAYRFGGIGLAVNTINLNFGLDIQKYMITDFDNLIGIVDTLGGLDVPLTDEEIEFYNERGSASNPIRRKSDGFCHLNGRQVLDHCRNRTLGNGDWSRTERQRAVMNSLYVRAKQEKDVASLTSLMYKLMGYVETNMSPYEMISLGTKIVFGTGGTAPIKATIPCTGSWSYAMEHGMAVIHIDLDKNREWLKDFLYGAS